MTLLIDFPALVLVPVCVLVALWSWSRSRVTLAAAILWVAYLGWELAISEDRPDANIRIDLLLIYPLLLVMTVLGFWTGRRARGTRARKGRTPSGQTGRRARGTRARKGRAPSGQTGRRARGRD